jgi:hypothetical protein
MTKTKRVILFIITILATLFLNIVLLIFENNTGLRLSRWLTFFLPISISYLVIFKLDVKSK